MFGNSIFLQIVSTMKNHNMFQYIKMLVFLFLFSGFSPRDQEDEVTYKIYRKGRAIPYEKMVKKIGKADIILFGEIHQKRICHDLQLQITGDLFKARSKKLIVGAEMFEADDQIVVNEFLQGLILERHLKYEAKLWPNYDSDYAPILHFAKTHNIDFIATNIPKRYANLVARKGLTYLDSLSKSGLSYICPLPLEVNMDLRGYQYLLKAMAGHGGSSMDKPENMVYAQAIKDATMAHNIVRNMRKGATMLHLNGTFHSDNYEGIYYYLKKTNPDLNVVTISTVVSEDFPAIPEGDEALGDFVLVVK
jgi:uncharacterized iron-regulated protein